MDDGADAAVAADHQEGEGLAAATPACTVGPLRREGAEVLGVDLAKPPIDVAVGAGRPDDGERHHGVGGDEKPAPMLKTNSGQVP